MTAYGGDLLLAETTLLPGKGKLTFTGKLGDVMREVGVPDGVYNVVHGFGKESVGEALVQQALDHGGVDNVTVLVVSVSSDG